MNFPWIPKETPRLLINAFAPEDAASVYLLLNSPGWKRFIGDRGIRTLNDALRYIEEKLTKRSSEGHGCYALRKKGSGELVGLFSLLQREALDAPDIGYALLPDHYGMGLAREAAQVLMQYLCLAPWNKVYGITHLKNIASRRLLEELGFRFWKYALFEGEKLSFHVCPIARASQNNPCGDQFVPKEKYLSPRE